MIKKQEKERPYFEIGCLYKSQFDDSILKMIGRSDCEMDDGQESCVLCHGRIIFKTTEGKIVEKCPYTFNPNNINWEVCYDKCK